MKYTEKTIKFVDYSEVERIIQDNYGFDEFNIPAEEELSNDTFFRATVSASGNSEYTQKDIDNRRKSFMARAYLNDLCRRRKIEPGEYFIEISW